MVQSSSPGTPGMGPTTRTLTPPSSEGVAAQQSAMAAALHMPAWVRRNLDDARLLLLYSRHDFVTSEWPESLALGVADQARRFESCLERLAERTWGGADAKTQ